MKKIISIISLIIVAFCLLFMVSCAGTVNEVGNLKLDTDTLTLSWDRVQGAKNYTVAITGTDYEKTTKDNKYSLEYLEPGTYEIKIKANGDGIEKDDSDWTVYNFVREAESGMRYKLINNKTEYQLVSIGTASGDIVMDDNYRGKPVTSIADKAFSGNVRVTSFTVGKYVKEIGASAFARCSELTSVTIPEGVTKIGKSCFQSCKKLESFAFPSTVTTVEEYIFSWCSALKSVSFGNKVDTVSVYAFSNCKSLEEVKFGDSLKTIGEYAFSDCEVLSKADFGNSLESIGPYAFYNCIKLADLKYGESVKLIDEYAFGNCDGLTSIAIPDSCEKIMSCAFRYCDNLTDVKIGTGVTYIGPGVFYQTKLYQEAEGYLAIDGWYLNCKDKTVKDVTVPAGTYGIADSAFYQCKEIVTVNLKGIKYISNSAFYGCEKLTYAMFDSSLISIGAYAFKNCKELLKTNLGSTLESIGDFAFSGCAKLQDKNVNLPASVRTIGNDAFKGTNATTENGIMYVGSWVVGTNLGPGSGLNIIDLKAGTVGIANYSFSGVPLLQLDMSKPGINIPDSVKYIGRGAFYQTAASGYAVTIKLSSGLKVIGDYAFYGNYAAFFDGMKTAALIIPEGCEYIGRSAFYGCESIYSLSVPKTVNEIGPYAFYGCINIGADLAGETEDDPVTPGYITLAEGIEFINDKAFFSCKGIKNLVIPNSVTKLGSRVFYKCSGLTSLTIGSGLTEISDYAFYGCEALSEIIIPDGVTSIGKYAFRGCASLTSLSIGKNVTEIGNFAFFGAEKLTSLVIPSSVTSIGTHAFRGMTYAKSIIIPASVKSIDAHAFYGAVSAVIYVESGANEADWNVRWNSSFAPVVRDAKLSEDRSYVESFVKADANPENMPTEEPFTAPVRRGYTFAGFSTEKDGEVKYTVDDLVRAKSGATLYTVWTN